MMEFKGQKAEALDKYLDGYYLFQAGLKKKQIFPTAKSIETDNQFRVKIVELGGIIPDEALNVQELYKEATKLKQESVKEGNRNMLLFVIIIAGLAVIGVLISTLDIAEVKDINSYALHFEGAETEQIDDTLHTVIAIQNEGKNNIHNFKMSVEYLDSGGDVVVSQTKIFSTTLGPRGKQFYKFKIDNSDRRIVSARYLRYDHTPF